MTELNFKVGDIAKVVLKEGGDVFPVGESVVVTRVDVHSNSYKYLIVRMVDEEDDTARCDWLTDAHLERVSEVIEGKELTYNELVEAVATRGFAEGYRINYNSIGAVDGAVPLKFNGVTFVHHDSHQPLSLDIYSATGMYELVGVEDVKHTYRLPDGVAKALEIGTCDAYLNYGECTESYWFDDVSSDGSVQTKFTKSEFANVPDMDGLKQLLIKGEAK